MATKHRIFCDTNFLLDVFDPQREQHADAIALLWYCADSASNAQLVASITSFKDAYYILSRLYKSESAARKSIASIMGQFVWPVDMLSRYGDEALSSDEPDFEDGLIRVCAEHEGATVILTRDKKAFATCAIPGMSAADFLAREGFDYALVEL